MVDRRKPLSPRQPTRRLEAAIKLADVLVKTLTSALGPAGTFTGELAGKGFDALLTRLDADKSKLTRQIGDIADTITTSALAPFEFVSFEQNDLEAAAEAVADTITAVPMDGQLLRQSGYTALGLAEYYRANATDVLERAMLGEAEAAYNHILESVSHQVLAVVRASPEAHAIALADLTQHLVSVERRLNDSHGLYQAAQGALLDEHLLTYRLHVASPMLSRRFATAGATTRTLRAGLAYVERQVVGPEGSESLNALLERGTRILIEADPGQGKTALLRRTFVWSLTRSHSSPVPIYLDLESLKEFPADLDASIKRVNKWLPNGPSGWVDAAVREGRALVLLDAVDDFLADGGKRVASEEDLDGFLSMAGHSTVVVTARKGTLGLDWIERHGFIVAQLKAPTDSQVIEQIERWHEAVAANCPTAEEQGWVTARGQELLMGLCQLSDLRGLGRDPLLCTLLCETFLDSSYTLPQDWISLVQKVLNRLADMNCLSDDPVLCRPEVVRDIQQEIAVWSVHNGPQIDPSHLADAVDELADGQGGAELVGRILFRGTFLRRGRNGLFFVNDHARDHLAAGDLMRRGNLGLLREKARQLVEPRLVVAAAGHGGAARATELINGLLDDALQRPEVSDALIVMACCGANAALSLAPTARQRALDAAADLIVRGDTSGLIEPAIAPLALDMLVRVLQSSEPEPKVLSMAIEVATKIGPSAHSVSQVILQEPDDILLASGGDLHPDSATVVPGVAMPGDETNGGN
ncbi:NACHT domain-containing protein [Micromonospora violae]|uniref:NACHT domain-containing protein n=1 Tax=Micromonospora violae TaxID=1278207 RepID=UPI0033CE67EE